MIYLTKANEITIAINKLALSKILWLDTETADWKTPYPKISLIQAANDITDITGDNTYILDVLNKPELVMYFINQIMVNSKIEKVFHNASYDLKFLGKERAKNITCTWQLAKKLRYKSNIITQLPNLKLKTLAEELCYFTNVDKSEQASDWRQRPLTKTQLEYAKMDAVYLAQIHRRLLEISEQNSIKLERKFANYSHYCSFSVTKVRVAFECPRLFYLGQRWGGNITFLPGNNSSRIGTQFHQLADNFAFVAKQDDRFSLLLKPEVEELKVDAIAQQMQQLFYELSFFPHLQAIVKTNPSKANTLYQLWEALKRLIYYWAKLLVEKRRYCNYTDVISKTLITLKPTVKHSFQLADGTQQLVQGRFDSIVYDFANHRLRVVEYKTYLAVDKSAQLAQVALYSYMLKEKLGVPINSAVYSVLPNWEELIFTGDELEKTVHQLIPQKLQQMRQWIAWEAPQPNPPPPTTQPELLCNICPQKTKCQSYFEPNSESKNIVSQSIETPQPTTQKRVIVASREDTQPNSQKQETEVDAIAHQLVETLQSFKLGVDYLGSVVGSAFIRVKLKPHLGVKFSSIVNTSQDLKVHLGIANIPLIATQPGYISVDLPRPDRQIASFAEYITPASLPPNAPVKIALGINLAGKLVEADLADPNTCHFLVGGTTGSGKSEFLRSLLLSLIMRHSADNLKIVLVDPKRVTFPEFANIPWLYSPIVKESDRAIALMEQLVKEMSDRYQRFEAAGCADISTYNQKASQVLPRIVCIFDEYADFMAEKDSRTALEQSIKRLGAMARAAGIHLIIATQRPEAKVVTPIIRSNLPGRVALRTASEADSAIILGGKQTDAANLLGKGDLLYLSGASMYRLQSLLATSINIE
ncbi:DNA translocase FtsK [Aliterella atlantica]|uniref:Cell division protein FtsK n=1 Tax=Aliterella atlantica CENA595 TaxID=1618023 RepID=A0A0D8ZS79_9CYAN|nr:DNA translocase FtsK [Aliterella atlantica]KJH71668.1 cell division protein FtsK [Aliterella atlantica CENA595]